MLSDAELLRYSRQIMLPQVDVAGQEKLARARALIIGLGGIGCPVAQYLAAAGVGELHLVDFDAVDESNLQRQVLFTPADVGVAKVSAAAAKLRLQNPHVVVRETAVLLTADNLPGQVGSVDLVIDGSDNFATRQAVNAACVAAGVPLVSAAAIGLSAQLALFDTRAAASPCYRCLYPEAEEAGTACAESGVLAPVVGVAGTLAATVALKQLAALGAPWLGRLWLWDADTMTMRSLAVPRDPACPVCSRRQGG